ncbi:LTA synthase family protein [Streptococcus pluranimalium]
MNQNSRSNKLINNLHFGIVFIIVITYLILKSLITSSDVATKNINIFFDISHYLYLIFIPYLAWFISFEVNFSYIKKLISVYCGYLLISYFLTITRNLNNGQFNIFDFTVNRFFQVNFLSTLGTIIILSVFFKSIRKIKIFKNKKNQFLFLGPKTDSIIYIISSFIITDDLSLQVISRLYSQFLSVGLKSFFLHIITYIICIYSLYSFSSFCFVKGIDDFKSNRSSFFLAFTSSFLFGLFFNYLLQYGVKSDEALMDMFIFPAATIYQILLISFLSFFVYLIVNRYLIASFFISIFWGIISVINIVKMRMRNEPMLLTDFSWIKQIRLVMEFIDIQLTIYISLALFFFLGLFIFLRTKFFTGKIIKSFKIRFISLVILLCIFVSAFNIFRNEKNRVIKDGIPIISQLNNNYNTFWLDLSYHARYRSLLFVWTKQLTAEAVQKPKEYSKEKMDEIYEKYNKIANEINKDRKNDLRDQTVIFILSESYARPNRLDGISISEDISPNIDNIIDSTTSGTMKSDRYGGGTANMEWQSLVGLPMYKMSESISTINTEVVPGMEYIPSISDSFIENNRVAIHLGDAATYSRNNFYLDKLEFKTFIAKSNGTKNINNFEKLGLFPSDRSTYDTLLESLDESQSQFFSVITYQNHIPYERDEPNTIIATGEKFSNDENKSLTAYSRLMYYTDLETRRLIDKLSKIDKKITVVFYGDHLPGFYPSSQFTSNPISQYETDYFIWSNFNSRKLNFPYINSSDFPAALLAQTNSKVSPYYALLTNVLENASVDKINLSKEQKAVSDDLSLVEYDLISGKGYLNDRNDFFTIRK